MLPADTVMLPVLGVLVDLPKVKVGTVEPSPTVMRLKVAPPVKAAPKESKRTAPEVLATIPPLP